MNILAIDLGSSSFKVGLFGRSGRLLAASGAALRYRYGPDGAVELGVADAERALRRALRDTLAGRGPVTVDAVALTSQAQTFTAVDCRGRATRPFASWQDTRAKAAARRLRRRLPDAGRHIGFDDWLPALQACQAAFRPVSRGEQVACLPAYFVRRWTGETVTDANLAAMSGLYSLVRRDWWTDALQACSLRRDQVGRIVPVGAVAGRTGDGARTFGLPAGVPVVLAGNDQTAGACAARLEESGALLLTLGTAQAVYACAARLPAPRPGTVRGPYPGGLFYRLATDSGGNLVRWAETILAGCASDAMFFRQAARAPAGCNGLRFDVVPDRAGGTWRGLALGRSRADCARSILEGLARRTAALVRRVAPDGPRRPLLAGGGGSRQPLWIEILSETLRAPVRPIAAEPLYGAARMAAAALRGTSGGDAGRLLESRKETAP